MGRGRAFDDVEVDVVGCFDVIEYGEVVMDVWLVWWCVF